jgi:hypothetical protein
MQTNYHNGKRYMKHIEPPRITYQKKNRLTCAPAPDAAPRGANVAKQPGTGQKVGKTLCHYHRAIIIMKQKTF